jgi:hypothetical protein
MKKIVALIVVLTSLTCVFSVYGNIDLQPRNARFIDNSVTGIGQKTGLYVYVQNNGTEDFQGTFMLKLWSYSGDIVFNYSGTICAESYQEIYLPITSAKDIYSIQIDSHNDVVESNEDNNYFCYQDGAPQTAIISNGMAASDYRDTLFVLPGEYFYQQFSMSELNYQKAVFGFDFKAYTYGLGDAQDYFFGVQSISQSDSQTGELYGGKYSFQSTSYQNNNAYCQWMADSSAAAIDYFWLGHFYGVAKNMAVGSEANIYISINCATNNLLSQYYNVNKTIKVVDRIRGDVNDDGIVDQKDLDILIDVINNNLYNPCMSFKDIYQENGMNYGAGMVLFSQPDFISNCLLNIWLNDKTDPLVQGLGIGELISKTSPGSQNSSVQQIANTFEISGESLNIKAPGADLYNVTAQTTEGKAFQSTGKIGEQIKVPVGLKNVRVETVKVKQSLTAVTSVKSNINVSVYPTKISDYVNIKSVDKGIVRVVNLNGQIIFSSELKSEEELRISASSWASGVYIVNISSATGNKTVKVIK